MSLPVFLSHNFEYVNVCIMVFILYNLFMRRT